MVCFIVFRGAEYENALAQKVQTQESEHKAK